MKKQTKKAVPASPGATPAAFSAADFPQLQEFLRGYLHEDFKEEHGSALGALDEFCYSASKREREALKRDLDAFMALIVGKPFERVRDWWTRELGSAWLPPDKKALLGLQAQLNQADKDKQR